MKKLLLTSACLLGLAASQMANALSITPTSGVLNTSRWEGNETSQSDIDTAIAGIIAPSTELYKQDVGGGESGGLAGSYDTTFVPAGDESTATITYTGGDIVGPTAYGLVKDGKLGDPAWFLFDLTALGWNGTETLEFTGFWDGAKGAISHVTLYGRRQPGNGVPDGGVTAALLGLGVLGLGFLARRKA